MSRPTLVYSPKSSTSITYLSSRGSSRASTPPSTSYYASLDADPLATMRQLTREEEGENHHNRTPRVNHIPNKHLNLSKLLRKRPSKASLLHYLSLLLSIRLLLHTRRVWLLVLTVLLAISLEGRAKIEKLGLRGTMTICLALVGVGLAVGNMGVGWRWGESGGMGKDGCMDLKTVARGSVGLDDATAISMTVCAPARDVRSGREMEPLPDSLLQSAKAHMVGGDGNKSVADAARSGSVSALKLCREAADLLHGWHESHGEEGQSADRFTVQIVVEPGTSAKQVGAFNTQITCQSLYA